MSEKLSQYGPSTQPFKGGLCQAQGSGWLAARRRPTGSPGPWEVPGAARRAARPRPRLAVETGAAGTQTAGQSSLHTCSEARCPAGGCGVVRAGCRSSPQPGTPGPRDRLVPETGRRFCRVRDCHSRDPAAAPLRPGRDRLNWASVTPEPASPPNFLSFYLSRSEVVLGRLADFSQQLSRGRPTYCRVEGTR